MTFDPRARWDRKIKRLYRWMSRAALRGRLRVFYKHDKRLRRYQRLEAQTWHRAFLRDYPILRLPPGVKLDEVYRRADAFIQKYCAGKSPGDTIPLTEKPDADASHD